MDPDNDLIHDEEVKPSLPPPSIPVRNGSAASGGDEDFDEEDDEENATLEGDEQGAWALAEDYRREISRLIKSETDFTILKGTLTFIDTCRRLQEEVPSGNRSLLKRPRGRPRKDGLLDTPCDQIKRPRGRPRKHPVPAPTPDHLKRGRGRPRKYPRGEPSLLPKRPIYDNVDSSEVTVSSVSPAFSGTSGAEYASPLHHHHHQYNSEE